MASLSIITAALSWEFAPCSFFLSFKAFLSSHSFGLLVYKPLGRNGRNVPFPLGIGFGVRGYE